MGRSDRTLLSSRAVLTRCLILAALLLAAGTGLFWWFWEGGEEATTGFFFPAEEVAGENATQIFEGVEIEGRSPDGVFWTLLADRAASDTEGRVGRLEGVTAKFSSPEGAVETRSGRLDAREGGRILLEDGVTVTWNEFEAKMPWAELDITRRNFLTDAPVELWGKGVKVRGEGLRLDMNTRTARVMGGVHATMEGTGP